MFNVGRSLFDVRIFEFSDPSAPTERRTVERLPPLSDHLEIQVSPKKNIADCGGWRVP
jgi:hypothetical protein